MNQNLLRLALFALFALLPSINCIAKSSSHSTECKDPVFGHKKIVALPPCGKIAVGMGQTSNQLWDYRNKVLFADPKAPYPYSIALYTEFVRQDDAIPGSGFLSGLNTINIDAAGNLLPGHLPNRNSVDYDRCTDYINTNEERNGGLNDDMVFPATLSEYPTGVLIIAPKLVHPTNEPVKALSALYTGQNPFNLSDDILEEYRRAMEIFVCYCKNLDREVLVRPMYEIDFEQNGYAVSGDTSYALNAFRYFKQQMVENKAKNVGLIWHLFGSTWGKDGPLVYDTTKPAHYDLWYPGDKFVDWIGISYWIANESYQLQTPDGTTAVREIIYDFARDHKKPVVYAECSLTSLYINQNGENGSSGPYLSYWFVWPQIQYPQTSKEIWDNAFAYLFREIEDNRDVVRLLSYIDSDWGPSVNWGDSRLEVNDYIRAKFFKRTSGKKYYRPCRPAFCIDCEYPYSYPCPSASPSDALVFNKKISGREQFTKMKSKGKLKPTLPR